LTFYFCLFPSSVSSGESFSTIDPRSKQLYPPEVMDLEDTFHFSLIAGDQQ